MKHFNAYLIEREEKKYLKVFKNNIFEIMFFGMMFTIPFIGLTM